MIGQLLELDRWTQARAQATSNSSIDLERINRIVRVVPDKILEIHLSFSFSVAGVRSDNPTFMFNPGMVVRHLEVDGIAVGFSFHNGILELTDKDPSGKSSDFVVRIVALGVPNPRFAYIDAAVDYLTQADVSDRVATLIGTDASIFSKNYGASMPGNYWYPVPVRVGADGKILD